MAPWPGGSRRVASSTQHRPTGWHRRLPGQRGSPRTAAESSPERRHGRGHSRSAGGMHSPPRHLIVVHEGAAMCTGIPAPLHPAHQSGRPRASAVGSLGFSGRHLSQSGVAVSCRDMSWSRAALLLLLLSVLQWQTCDVIKRTPRIEIELAEHGGDPGIRAPAHLGRWHVKRPKASPVPGTRKQTRRGRLMSRPSAVRGEPTSRRGI